MRPIGPPLLISSGFAVSGFDPNILKIQFRITTWGLFSSRTKSNGFRLQVLRTQGLQASVNATASISSNLDKAFPFNPNHEKPLLSVLLLNKPQDRHLFKFMHFYMIADTAF